MRTALRIWLGCAAIGAGLIHLALAIGSPPPVAAAVVVIGLAEFGWGAIAFAASAPPIPRVARTGAVLPVLLWALLLIVAGPAQLGPFTSAIRLFPMLAASLLDLMITIVLTAMLRQPAPRISTTATHPALRLLLIAAGALAIVALTVPALSATEAGEQARSGTGFFEHQH